ncbi:MAG: hypothetical protein E6J90_05700 [Deltaproteobacteria bacterium]|nr:MAG: hypothetical protein E6J91_13060 [Deltaproteobacteria bacterium]TMQ25570.1 MAG: hypothetical protein E6J90_05700 [Deltaproteobacteria bacterium]
MKLQARFYVTTEGCTDAKAARELAFELAAPLDQLYDRKVISGYQSFVLKTEDDYEEHDLDRPLIERETHGVLPAIFLNITYRVDAGPPDVSAIEPVIAKYKFRHLLTE